MDLYFSYDDTNIYVAYKIVDTNSSTSAEDYNQWLYDQFSFSIGGDATDTSDGWRFYWRRNAATASVESWPYTNGSQGTRIDGTSDGHQVALKTVRDGNNNYAELSLNRADFGLTGNKIFFAVEAITAATAEDGTATNNNTLCYGVNSSSLQGFGKLYPCVPHVFFLGDKDSMADYLADNYILNVANCEDHGSNLTYVLNDAENHLAICSACGNVDTVGHSFGDSVWTAVDGGELHKKECSVCGTVTAKHNLACVFTEDPTLTTTGLAKYVCTDECGYEMASAAYVPADGHLLGGYGQHYNFVEAALEGDAPVMNGTIEDGEYYWSIEGLNSENLPAGTYKAGTTTDLTDVNFYFSYDETNVYVAAKITDTTHTDQTYQDYFWFYLGGDATDTGDAWKFFMRRPGYTDMEHWQFTNGTGSGNLGTVVSSGKQASGSTSTVDGVDTYEFCLNRADWGLTGDKLFVIFHATSAQSPNNERIFYALNATVSGHAKMDSMLPHAFFLGERSDFTEYFAKNSITVPACEHVSTTAAPINITQHRIICDICGNLTTGAHEFKNENWTQIDTETHENECSVCGTVTAEHDLDYDFQTYPTLDNKGQVILTCKDGCGYTTGDAIDYIPTDGHLLGAWGQKYTFLPPITATPTQDGTISENEYYWSIEGLSATNLPDGTFASGDVSTITDANFYFSYDATNLYFAAKITDTDYEVNRDYFWMYVGSDATDTGDGYKFFIRHNGKNDMEYRKFVDGAWTTGFTNIVKNDGGVSASVTQDGDVHMYEVAIDRATYGFTVDKLFVSLSAMTNNSPSITYGLKADAVSGFTAIDSRLPHVFFLGDKNAHATYLANNNIKNVANCESHTYKCVEESDTEHKCICTVCGYASVHNYESATWTEVDSEYHKTVCADCGKEFTFAHELNEVTPAVPATCTDGGTSAVLECTLCDYITGGTATEALGHAWDNACDTECNNNCGETRETTHDYKYELYESQHIQRCGECGATTDPADHEPVGDPTITLPTYAAAGSKAYVCTICELTYTEEIAQLAVPTDDHFLVGEQQPRNSKVADSVYQHRYFLGASASAAPRADGVITPGEYSWSKVDMEVNEVVEEQARWCAEDSSTYVVDAVGDMKSISVYASYDKDNIYLAAVVKETYSETDKNFDVIFRRAFGATPHDSYKDSRVSVENGSVIRSTNLTEYAVEKTATDTSELDVWTVEVVLDRATYGATDSDSFYLWLYVVTDDENGTAKGAANFGYETGNATISNNFYIVTGQKYRQGHVFFLGEQADFVDDATAALGADVVELFGFAPCADDAHDYVAVNGDSTSHTRVCTVCGDTVTDTFADVSWTPVTDTVYHATTCNVCRKLVCAVHVPEVVEGKAPTCTETGLTEGTICSVCGDSIVGQGTIDMLDHTYGEWTELDGENHTRTCITCNIATETASHNWNDGEVTTAPTCAEAGEKTYTCTECKATKTEEVAETGEHTSAEATVENEVAATCTEDGSYDSVVYCTVCNEELSRTTETVEKLGHTEGDAKTENEVAADCGNAGSYDTVVYCTVCTAELSRTTETVPATGEHTYDDDFDADCNVCGTERVVGTYVATINGEKFATLAAAVEAAEAEAEIVLEDNIAVAGPVEIAKKLVINLNGKTITAAEDTFGDGVFHVIAGGELTIKGEGTVNAVGNNAYSMAIWADGGKVIINGGTYTNVGASSTFDSDHFDLIYVKDGGEVVINGGTFECETPEWTLNTNNTLKGTITVYGGTFVGFNGVNKDGEDFLAEGYTATADNGNYVVGVCAHETYNSEITTDPTCTEKGVETFTCAGCGDDTYTKEVAALGHKGVIDAAVAADCENTGLTEGKHCSVCNTVLVAQTVVDALGHDMQQTAAAVAPKCEVAGTTAIYTCANGCGKTEGGEPIAALEHDMQQTAEAVAPKCEVAGTTAIYTCANGCGKTEGGEPIAALEHDMQQIEEAVAPTCGKAGKTAVLECANGCGKTEGG